MGILFEEKKDTEVVTAQDIKDLTGIKSDDFQFVNEENKDEALNKLLEKWIERVASHIYVRISRTISVNDKEFFAIQDVLIRTVANIVSIAQQQRSNPVIQIDDFAVNILNTSEVTKNLDHELKPFIQFKEGKTKAGWVSVFSSLEKYKDD